MNEVNQLSGMFSAELLFYMLVLMCYAGFGSIMATGNAYRENQFCFVMMFWPIVFIIKVAKGFIEFIKPKKYLK